MLLGFAPLLLLLGVGGRLLPTWMFLNSMQLIVHTPMLATYVPANLHYFLVKYLSIFRLNSKQINDLVKNWQLENGLFNYQLISDKESKYSVFLSICGYKYAFSHNLILFLLISIVLLVLIAGLSIFSCLKSRRNQQRKRLNRSQHGAWSLNFSLRFVY